VVLQPGRRPEGGPEVRLIDLCYGGRQRVIGAWVVDETILVDPGPAITVDRLLAGLAGWRPRAIALTHIHLDHAGATGTLLDRWPGCEVWVHEAGAPHLVSPERLLASAARVYGDQLEAIWGETKPVPGSSIRRLTDGEPAGPFEVLETPGHASHHLSYIHGRSKTAFVGDVAGVRISPAKLVLAPTVAPEFDPVGWKASIERLASRRPARLALTHFGVHEDVVAHLEETRKSVERWAATGRDLDHAGFTRAIRQTIVEATDPATAAAYEDACRPEILWSGVQRYWSRRERGARPGADAGSSR
jgi:glyoxylase-like metal-dependent hydrolase (beta-lactamase superfamily II)